MTPRVREAPPLWGRGAEASRREGMASEFQRIWGNETNYIRAQRRHRRGERGDGEWMELVSFLLNQLF